jgi:hypothetical protein
VSRRVLPEGQKPRSAKLGPRPLDGQTFVRPWPPAPPYWITRDSDPEGDLLDVCEVWTHRPERLRVTDTAGAMWLSDLSPIHYLHGRYHVDEIRAHVGTVPDTDIECVRVG